MLFLQFKLTDWMTRRNACEVRTEGFTTPFYRMPLRALRRSRQHEMLLALESPGHVVRYVAPLFHQAAELNAAYFGHLSGPSQARR